MNRDSERIYDEYLVASAQAGDGIATSRLTVRWQPRLLRHAWRLVGDADRAKDAVQDAWIEILRGIAHLDDVAAFPAWAFRIVGRRCRHLLRKPAWDPLPDDEGLEPALRVHENPELQMDVATIHRVMVRLPPAQRAALALFYLEDMSVAEIAVALDVPPGTVKTRLMHARLKVREALLGDVDGQV